MNEIILAAVSGEGVVNQLIFVLIVGLCILIVWWIGKYFITAYEAPPMAMKIWNGLFVLLGGLCIINFLLSLADKAFIKW